MYCRIPTVQVTVIVSSESQNVYAELVYLEAFHCLAANKPFNMDTDSLRYSRSLYKTDERESPQEA